MRECKQPGYHIASLGILFDINAIDNHQQQHYMQHNCHFQLDVVDTISVVTFGEKF